MKTISVVTISFNQARFIELCLNSVLTQKGVDMEYIVVDPGSTDGSRDIIDAYRHKLAHVIYEKDDGPADGLNRGLARCTGEYFYFLNSDDVVVDGAFSEAAEIFKKTRADVVYGNGFIVDEHGSVIRHVVSSPTMSPWLYARGAAVILQQAAFMRTDALRSVGGFNVGNRTSWDGEAFFEMARAGAKFHRAWRDWGLFRLYATSISGGGVSEAYAADCARIRAIAGLSSGGLLNRALDFGATAAVRALDYRRLLHRRQKQGTPFSAREAANERI